MYPKTITKFLTLLMLWIGGVGLSVNWAQAQSQTGSNPPNIGTTNSGTNGFTYAGAPCTGQTLSFSVVTTPNPPGNPVSGVVIRALSPESGITTLTATQIGLSGVYTASFPVNLTNPGLLSFTAIATANDGSTRSTGQLDVNAFLAASPFTVNNPTACTATAFSISAVTGGTGLTFTSVSGPFLGANVNSPGAPPVTFPVSPTTQVDFANNAQAATGSYVVSATNVNGCPVSATSTVTINALPTLTSADITAPGNNGTVCLGSIVTLRVNTPANTTATVDASLGNDAVILNGTSTGPYVTYLPTPATFTANAGATGGPTGLRIRYAVTVTDANGCVSAPLQVTATEVDIPANGITYASGAVCPDVMQSLTAADATVTSSTLILAGVGTFTGGRSLSFTTPSSAVALTYVTTNAAGCVSTQNVSTFPTANFHYPVGLVATATPTSVCAGGTVTLNVSNTSLAGVPTAFAWSSADAASLGVTLSSSTVAAPTATVSVTSTGGTATYTISATSTNGCVGTATVGFIINALPVAVASALSSTICLGDVMTITTGPVGTTATLNAAAATGYYAFDGATATPYSFTAAAPFSFTSNSPAVAGIQNYSVTVTDANGCVSLPQAVTVLVVGQPRIANLAATPNAICSSNTLSLTANVDVLNGPSSVGAVGATVNFFLNGTQVASTTVGSSVVSQTVTAPAAGNYTVTASISLNGCSSTVTAANSLTINETPAAPTNIQFVQTGTLAACYTTGPLAATATCPTGTYASFANSTPSNSFTNTTSFSSFGVAGVVQTYTVTCVSSATAGSCPSSASVVSFTINANPTLAPIAQNGPVCSGEPISLSATVTPSAGITYVWSTTNTAVVITGGASMSNVMATFTNVPTSQATIPFTVTATNSAGCSTTGTVDVGVRPAVSVALASSAVCAGTPISLSVTVTGGLPNYTLASTFVSGSTAVIANGPATTSGQSTTAFVVSVTSNTSTAGATNVYSVTLTDGNGCSTTATTTLNVNPNPTLTFSASPAAQTLCAGTVVTLTPSGATSYSFNAPISTTGMSATAVIVAGTNTFVVSGTDLNGCTNTASYTVLGNEAPTFAATTVTPNAVCGGSSLTLTATSGNGTGTHQTSFFLSGSTTPIASLTNTRTGITPSTTTVTVSAPAVTATTVYTVTAQLTDMAGCTALATVASLTVNPTSAAPALENIVFVETGTRAACAGTSPLTLTAVCPTGFTANIGGVGLSNSRIFTGVPAGVYNYTVTCDASTGCQSVGTPISVTINASPTTPVIAPSGPAVCSGQSYSFTAASTVAGPGSTTGITYAWSGSNITGSTTGSAITASTVNSTSANITVGYTVTATSEQGCSTTNVAMIVVYPAISFASSFIAPVCAGQPGTLSVVVTGGTGATPTVYLGSSTLVSGSNPPFSTATLSFATATVRSFTISVPTSGTVGGTGVYSLTLGDNANACTGTTSATLVVNPLPPTVITALGNGSTGETSTANTFTFCAGTPVTLTVPGSASAIFTPQGATQAGSPVGTSSYSVGAQPTTFTAVYSVNVSSSLACPNSATATVVFIPLPAAPTVTSSGLVSGAVCVSAAAALSVNCPQGTPSVNGTSLGTTSTGSFTISTSTVGTFSYSVVCISPNVDRCPSIPVVIPVTVNGRPQVSLSAPAGACAGQTITLTASTADGNQLNFSTGFGNAVAANQVLTTQAIFGNSLTSYSVTATNAANCTSTTVVSVSVNPAVTFNSVSAPAVCAGQTSTVTAAATGGTGIQYSLNGVTNATGVFTLASTNATQPLTTYQVSATNATGCVSSTTVQVVVNSLPTPSIVPATQAICIGGTATLAAVGSASLYVWSNGQSGATLSSIPVSPTVTTTYTVIVTNSTGCTAAATATVTVNPLPTVAITAPAGACAGQTITLSATTDGNQLNFSNGSGQAGSSYSTQVIFGNVTTVYSVTASNASGCVSTTSVSVSLNPALTNLTASAPAVCAGQTSTITAVATGGTGIQYSFNGVTNATGVFTLASTSATQPLTTYQVSATNATGCTATGTVNVVVNSNPTPSISPAAPSICAGQTITLATVGSASSYSWSTGVSGATASSIQVSAAGTYTVIVTNSNGCTAAATATVTVNPVPVVGITASSTVACPGQTVTLTGTGATVYNWSNFQSAPSIQVTSGVYSVTGINTTTGCSSVQSVTVRTGVIPTVAISPTNAAVCPGQSTTLTASGATSYTWSTGAVTASVVVSPMAQTQYVVTGVNADGCSNTAFTTVNINPAPQIGISGNTPICIGGSTVLTATGAASYTWNTGATTATIPVSPTATTTYMVMGTNASGCVASQTATVTVNPLPVVAITGTLTICAGQSTMLTASGGTSYAWSNAVGGQTTTVTPTATTPYSVTVTNANGCVAVGMVTVVVNPLPTAAIAPTGAAICAGASTVLTASGGGTYAWSNGAVTAAITVTPMTTTPYTVTVTSANGCVATASATVQVNAVPSSQLVVTDSPICAGASTMLTISGGASYSWSTGATTSNIMVSPAATTTYSVIVTGANGCTAVNSGTVVVNPVPIAAINGNLTVCAGTPTVLTASGSGNYAWSNGANTAAITVSPMMTTPYSVTVTSAAGCAATASATVTVNPTPVAPVVSSMSACAGSFAVVSAQCATGTPRFTDAGGNVTNGATVSTGTTAGGYTYSVACVSGACVGAAATITASVFACTPPVSASSLALVQPGYNCSTGLVTFNTTGGDGSPIVYRIVAISNFNSSNQQTIDLPVRQDMNNSTVTLEARQGNTTVSLVFNFRAFCTNNSGAQAPTAPAIGNQLLALGQQMNYTVPAFIDPQGQALSYFMSGLPANLVFNPLTRIISGPASVTGTFQVTVTATNTSGLSTAVSFFIQVQAPTPGQPPVVPNLPNQTGQVNVAFTYTVPAFGGSGLAYSATGIPTGLTFNMMNRSITGTPTAPGTFTVTITANDGANSSSGTFTITVAPAPVTNMAPMVSNAIPNQNGVTGQAFSFQFAANTFTDPNGDALTYSASGLPNGVIFNGATRTFSGTPSSVGSSVVTVSASDGSLVTQTTFTFNVTAPVSGNACGSPANTIGQPLAILQPTFDCATRTLRFNTTGGDGSAITYFGIGVTGNTTSCTVVIDGGNTDNATYTLRATQNGTTVTTSWTRPCFSGRQGVELGSDLSVTVMENPTAAGEVEVMVRGAEGQSLQFRMSDARGNAVSERSIEKSGAEERQTIGLGRSAGMYFLQVVTPTQSKTVKVVRQ